LDAGDCRPRTPNLQAAGDLRPAAMQRPFRLMPLGEADASSGGRRDHADKGKFASRAGQSEKGYKKKGRLPEEEAVGQCWRRRYF